MSVFLNASTTNSSSPNGSCRTEGSKTSRELPGIVDQIITYQFLDFGDGKPPMRGFVCTTSRIPGAIPPKIAADASIRSSRPISARLLSKLTNQQTKENLHVERTTNFDFNDAGEQRSFDVIPANTICTLQMTVRPGGAGDGGWLTRAQPMATAKASTANSWSSTGQYAKRKLWQRYTLHGTTPKHAEAGEISRNTLRAILESARGIRPDDKSEAAQAARKLAELGATSTAALRRPPRREAAQGRLQGEEHDLEVITPDRQGWQKPEQIAPSRRTAPQHGSGATPPANAITRPQWAE